MLPTLFISHGSPQLAIMNNKTTHFLQTLHKKIETPKALLVISAHWVTKEPKILANEDPLLIYDFYGFPNALYEVEYPASNDLKRVKDIIHLAKQKNILLEQEFDRSGYDHGVWTILKHLYPKANIPVIQISLPISYSIEELLKLGEALAPLREDTLIIASGAMSHNLRNLDWDNIDAEPFIFSANFRDWMVQKLQKANISSLKNFLTEAPNTIQNHPTLEHILPLFISMGASKNKKGNSIHNEYMYGQSMDSIIFKE